MEEIMIKSKFQSILQAIYSKKYLNHVDFFLVCFFSELTLLSISSQITELNLIIEETNTIIFEIQVSF